VESRVEWVLGSEWIYILAIAVWVAPSGLGDEIHLPEKAFQVVLTWLMVWVVRLGIGLADYAQEISTDTNI
jgi:hypothetical protein